jgi:hypothetical protein
MNEGRLVSLLGFGTLIKKHQNPFFYLRLARRCAEFKNGFDRFGL